MAFEIRPALPEEMADYCRVASTALVMPDSAFVGMRPEWTLCGFEDGKLATSFAAWPMTMRWNGAGVPVSGVTAVGTLPAHRRHGHLRRVMQQHFKNLHDQGERHIATLWASWAAIYQRYGYGIAGARFSYTIEPKYIEFAERKPLHGRLRDVSASDIDEIAGLYREFVVDRNGYLHRGKLTWEAGVLAHPPAGGTLNIMIYEEGGKALGYIIYATQPLPADPVPNHRLQVRDLVWLDVNAYRAFWENLATMDAILEVQWPRAPEDDLLQHLLLEPRRLRATAYDSLLNRIITVDKALEQRTYQHSGKLVFELVDELCPWNQGQWKLETSPQGRRVTRTKEPAQVTLPVSTLALLAFGRISASEAARMGRMVTHDAAALPAWDAVMRTMYRAACPDMF